MNMVSDWGHCRHWTYNLNYQFYYYYYIVTGINSQSSTFLCRGRLYTIYVFDTILNAQSLITMSDFGYAENPPYNAPCLNNCQDVTRSISNLKWYSRLVYSGRYCHNLALTIFSAGVTVCTCIRFACVIRSG